MNKKVRQVKRRLRTRSKITTRGKMPRLTVHRSNKFTYAQLVDDGKGLTMLTVSEQHLDTKKGTKGERAKQIGMLLAKKAREKKITKVVFDRSGYIYAGRVRALAEGAKEGGLEF